MVSGQLPPPPPTDPGQVPPKILPSDNPLSLGQLPPVPPPPQDNSPLDRVGWLGLKLGLSGENCPGKELSGWVGALFYGGNFQGRVVVWGQLSWGGIVLESIFMTIKQTFRWVRAILL